MDNNQYNNGGSKSSFYSYNQGSSQNDGNQVAEGTERVYENTTSYSNSYGSSNGNVSNGGYQGGTYQSSGYRGGYQGEFYQNQMNQQVPPKQNEKKRREKKSGGFGTKIVKCAALALVFGTVSGAAFQGVQFASGKVFRDTGSQGSPGRDVLTQSDTKRKVESTATSSNFAATGVADIVDSAMPSIVAITNVSEIEYRSFWGGMPQRQESTSVGSGIIASQDGNYLYIVTNNHVVDGATSLTVTFHDNTTVSAEVKGTAPSTDLAVIKVALGSIEEGVMQNLKVATLGDSDELRVGEVSIAIGNALGYGQSVTTGCISAVSREVSVSDPASNTNYTAELIQTDAAINPGNSGGALLNAKGEVVGINSVKYADTGVEGIGYAIPISTAIPIIEDLITKEKVDESESAYLGIAGVDVSDDVSQTYSMPSGVFVVQVNEGSAAEKAGIQKGDIVTKFGGRTITSMEDLVSTLEYYKAGTEVDVTILRASGGEYLEQTVSVTLGKKI